MCRLFETIKCENGTLFNLEFHQARFDYARKNYFGISERINLNEVLQIPENYSIGLYRCRVTYSEIIEKIEFFPHKIREIKSLKLVEENEIDYSFTYSKRVKLNSLFEKRGDCDDILIIKNGFVSDSFTANVIFFDGEKWWTPDSPLLHGTQRARLIDKNRINVCKVTVEDISRYQKAGLINALQDLDNMPTVETINIHR